jgi:hypothetical protein
MRFPLPSERTPRTDAPQVTEAKEEGRYILVLASGRRVRADFPGATEHNGEAVVSVHDAPKES